MNKIPYIKPVTTPVQQVDILRSRGIIINDIDFAIKYLTFHNYYQLSGYIYYFEIKDAVRTHRMAKAITFEELVELANFDQRLREHFFKGVLLIESAFRCVLAREIALATTPFGLVDSKIFRDSSKYPNFLEILSKALTDHKKEPFISHFITKYSDPFPPAWVMVEILTLGTISKLYSQITTSLQKQIARSFHVNHSSYRVDHIVLISWLKSLTELRNSCAHHSRLWNRIFVNFPKATEVNKRFPLISEQNNRLGGLIPLIDHLLKVIGGNNQWLIELHRLILGINLIQPKDMGLTSWDIISV